VSVTAVETRPYIGLRYFEERDAHLFYGRDEHVSELMAKVARNRFVAVMGSSGCGKSSLVRAGLLPELRSGMIPKAGPRWKVVEFRPGRAPLQELARAIRSELGVERAQELVEEGPLGMARAVAEAKLVEGTNVLVIADQYEEVFRFQHEESSRGRWMEAAEGCQALTRRLLDAAAQPELPIYVLLVMRSDYLGECAQFPDLPERMSESLYLVPRLRRDQLQEAITAPVGGAIEPAVVQRLLSEVGSDPDQLPRLQHLLGRMWDRAKGGRLTMDHYSDPDVGGWENGLEVHLEQIYDSFSAPQQTVCARVFQQLSELDKGRAVRRRAEIGELIEVCGSDAVEVVGKFRAEGFVTSREDPVDITHECILREWPRLRGWLDREARNARRLRELADAAKDAGWPLTTRQERPIRELAGLTLQNLVKWRDDAQPTAAWARRYLTTVDFERASDYLTWSERRDKAQKKYMLLRTRALLVLFVLLLLGSAVASLVFYRMKQEAEITARQSKARELAGFSTESLSEDPEKSTLLGMQAVNATLRFGQPPVRAAEEALIQALLSTQVRTTLRGHSDYVGDVAFSPDGKRLATSSGDHTAKVWDTESGKELLTLRGHSETVSGVAFSPDGKRLATSSFDQTARIWDVGTGKEVLTLRGHWSLVYGVAYSPDGKHLATASLDTAKVWDAESGKELLTLRGSANSVAFSPDGKRLATASDDHTAKVWDAETGKELLTLRGSSRPVEVVAFSPDGKRLATTNEDDTAKVWDAKVGKELLTLRGHLANVRSVAFSPDGKRLATSSGDHTAKVWDAETGKELLTLRGSSRPVEGVAFSPDGKRLATAGDDNTAKIWDVETGKDSLILRGHSGAIYRVVYSTDGQRLATACFGDKTAKIWDTESGKELLTLRGHSEGVTGVAFSPDGKRLATASYDNTAKVWDAKTGKELLTLRGSSSPVEGVAFSPDGKRLAIASYGGTKVWDAETGRELLTLGGHSEGVTGVAFSPDGKRLATADNHGTATVWDAETGEELQTLRGNSGNVRGVAFSPDSKRLATADENGTVKVWDAETGKDLLTQRGHSNAVTGVAFSPDGKRLATASWDNTAKVWDAESGKELLTLRAHSGAVYGVAFSPDGKRLATASEDGTVMVYVFDPRELLNLARSRVTRTFTADECQRYFQSGTCPPLP
jgi:WD40 repeat protein